MKPGVDLRGKNLSFLDLSGLDLTGADFRGAICIRTKFNGTTLTGARFDGAEMFMAELLDAVGADLTGAKRHPFVQPDPEERVGAVRFFTTLWEDGDLLDLPHHLVCMPDLTLFWLQGDQPEVCSLTPTGVRVTFNDRGDRVLLALAKDRQDQLWVFGDRQYGIYRRREPGLDPPGRSYVHMVAPSHFTDRPTGLWPAQSGGGVVAQLPAGLMHFLTSKRKAFQVGTLPITFGPGTSDFRRSDRLFWTGDGSFLLAYGPDRNEILAVPKSAQKGVRGFGGPGVTPQVVPLPPGCVIQDMTEAPGGRIWFTQTEPAAVVSCHLGKREVKPIDLEAALDRSAGGPPKPGRIVIGPDQAPWFTLPERGSIARVLPGGQIREFPLGDAHHPIVPEELVSSADGRLYFTVKGQHLLGSLLVVPKPAAQVQVERAEAEPESKAAGPVETKAQAPAEAMPPAAAAPGPGPAPAPEAPAAAVVAETKVRAAAAAVPKPTSPPAAPPRPAAKALAPSLEAINVHLDAEGVRHILDGHAPGTSGQNGRFTAPFASEDGIPRLLARGMLEAGEIARVRSNRRAWDGLGRYVTYCEVPGAGEVWDGSAWTATDRFVVITNRYIQGGYWHYKVITAFPVF
jgi:hypothetical protein